MQMGFENFVWFIGKVVDRDDPLQIGRVRVRIFSLHHEDNSMVPLESLPWATVSNAVNSSSQNGVGISPTGIQVNSWVIGFFLDGNRCQQPVITATLAGKDDVHSNAQGIDLRVVGTLPFEPTSSYGSIYPYNKVTSTEAGHIIEVDDTPGYERISFYHKSGSYYEISANGSIIHKSIGNSYQIIADDQIVYIGGDVTVNIQGDANINVQGDLTTRVGGNFAAYAEDSFSIMSPSISLEELTSETATAVAQEYNNVKTNGAIAVFDDEVVEGGTIDNELLNRYPPVEYTNILESSTIDNGMQKRTATVACLDINSNITTIAKNDPLYLQKLSDHFILGDLSTKALYSHTIQAQNDNTVGDIVCNLKALAENILDPIYTRYPGLRITSGFRVGSGKSQHFKGQAVDIQWPNKTNQEVFEIAKWIASNLNIDQLIVEHGNKLWLHISYDRNKTTQRGSLNTMVNNNYQTGLKLYG